MKTGVPAVTTCHRDFWPMAVADAQGDNRDMTKEDHWLSLQVGAAVLTWAMVTGFAWYLIDRQPDPGVNLPWFLGWAVLNLGTTLLACWGAGLTRRIKQTAHAVGLFAVFAAGWMAPINFLPIYSIVWLAVACSLYPTRVLWGLLAGIVAGWYTVMRFGWNEDSALISTALYGSFHLFALLTARSAEEAAQARDEAQFLNRELIATQHLLSEASRQSERTRIARDLHDMMGHHLTALSINLQIAERLAEGPVASKIAESRALARLLLSDVREAVSTLREECQVDFDHAIRLLVDQVPQLEVDLDIAPDVAIEQFEVAESLLRCVQEALTNTLRHAGASRSWIRVWQGEQGVHLEIHDNGVRGQQLSEGHGLNGMRERLAGLKGSLSLDTVGNALRLRVLIPHP